jgi:leukotriene-A4 hydrolase
MTGDKSPQPAIANALAQSWSGQLVTNATWRDRWLNQAFAAYLQRRIMSAVAGEQREAVQEILDVEAFRAAMSACDGDDQLLATDLTDIESDEVCAGVAAEKGSLLLTWLEAKFGRDKFDAFLRGYFSRFAAQAVSSEQFLGYLQETLIDRYPGIATRAEINAWISNPGLPDDAILPAADAAASIDAARASFLSGKVPAAKIDVHDWSDPEWIYFLGGMPALPKLEQLGELDHTFSLTANRSPLVAQAWLLLAIRGDYRPAFTRLEAYLKSVGRSSLLVPLYAQLAKTPAGFEFAQRVYPSARPGYDSQVARQIEALIKIDSTATE